MAGIRLFTTILIAILSLTTTEGTSCECGLYLSNEYWLPQTQVFTTSNNFLLNCTDFGVATERCKSLCSDEMSAMRTIFHKGVFLKSAYSPSEALACDPGVKSTITFSRACGSQNFVLSSSVYGPAICCDPQTLKNKWCSYETVSELDYSDTSNMVVGRKLDLQASANDVINNEIEGSTKPIKHKVGSQSVSADNSWLKVALKFFGYKSFADIIKNVDIFAIPSQIQKATKTYKDELSMGRCYMEFTTFKVFTKQESPLEGLFRRRRDTGEDREEDLAEDLTTVEEIISTQIEDGGLDERSLQDIATGLSSYFGNSDGRQYAGLINTAMKLLPALMNSQGSGGASGGTSGPAMLFNMLGPVFAQMTKARPPPNRIDQRPQQKPQTAATGGMSPMANMAVNVVSNLLQNYMQGGSAASPLSPSPRPTTQVPPRPSQPQTTLGSSGIGSLLNMFFQSANRPASSSPRPAKPVTKRPQPVPLRKRPQPRPEDKEEKTFVDKLIDLIRPVFISIVGNAPGESGVKAIRRVSTLSTLGRVDDTLKEEVDHPLFCLKRYAVNKAWTVTETGLRTVVKKFTPAEQERMQKMLF